MPGKKYASLKKPVMYEGLRAAGHTKTSAAKISNAAAKKKPKPKPRPKRPRPGY